MSNDQLAERLLSYCIDWDGSTMPDGAEPRVIPTCGDLRDCAQALNAIATPDTDDKARLDFIQYESIDLRCFTTPSFADDADIGWRAIGHYQGKPTERVIGEVFHDSVRDAIDAARAALKEHGAYSPKFVAPTPDTDRVAVFERALQEIANAVRLGAQTDIQAWANLAHACQETARAALSQPLGSKE